MKFQGFNNPDPRVLADLYQEYMECDLQRLQDSSVINRTKRNGGEDKEGSRGKLHFHK